MGRRYLIAWALAATSVFAVAVQVHDLRSVDFVLLASAFRAQGRVVLFGNSINRTISRCDADRRDLPDLLAASGASSVLNLSRGGMTLAQMLRIAEISTSLGLRPTAVVFPVTFAELLKPAAEPYGWRAFLRDNVPALSVARLAPPPEPGAMPYKGRRYGTYGEFSRTHFEREKREGRCPEGPGVDTAFVEFMYWRNYLQPDDLEAGLADTMQRAQALRRRGVAVGFWFPPFDAVDIRALHGPAAVDEVTRKIGVLAATLAAGGFRVFDTSTGLAADGFADRWCACGHLTEVGRARVAGQLASGLASWPRPAAAR